MEAVFTFGDKGEGIFENITDVEAIETIDIKFNNTGKFIPAFIYSQKELDHIQVNNAAYEEALAKANSERNIVPPEPEPVIPEFPKTGKYFSPRLLEELQKFTNLKEINIIADGRPVEMDDSFPTYCQVNIIDSTSDGAKSAVRAVVPVISTPADLFALMQSTNTVEMADTYTLANDIDMTGFVCESIGRISTPFTGTFDGQGHTIRIADVSSSVFGGLFGLVTTGTIQNVNVVYTNANLTLNGIVASGTTVYNGGLVALINGTGNANSCNVVYDGNVIITSTITNVRNSGFGNLQNGAICDMCTLTTNGTMTFNKGRGSGAFGNVLTNCTLSNFTYTAKDDIVINSTFANSAGCIGIVSESIINNFTANINGNLSLVGIRGDGGCIGNAVNNSQITNINCTFKNITMENSIFTMGGFAGTIANTIVSNVVFNANDLTMNSPYDTSIFISDGPGATISNCSIVLTGNVLSSCLYFGGLCSYIGNETTTTITDCNCLVNKDVNCTQNDNGGYFGGMYGVINNIQLISTNNSVFYGTNTEFNSDNIGGIAGRNDGSHTNSIVVYNNYTFTGINVATKFATGTGTETNCFVNTFSSNTSVIPNNNTTDVLAALSEEPTTAWLSSLLKIRQNLDVSNNSQSLRSIFTSSPDTSNTAKNNALNVSMAFAGVAYINTTPSIIQPLLVKYSSILPSNIRYAVPDENNEIDVSDATSYYIYQNPAYIVPANKTILSSTEGDGSVAFDTEVVPVGSKTTINDVVYNVVGVGSSLIEVVKGGNETVSSNSLSIAFAIIAGVILLLVVIFTYLYGWRGYMFLPVIIAIVMIVIAIIYAI